ncbi:MAG: phage tail protein [Hymenobacter sp.]|nr:MAG: phage tail protein [Hymenobacter sp.]
MDPFMGEIRLMPYPNGYITRGWAPCNGQLLPIRQNTALFALLGVAYGGDGSTTFGLPNLNGRAITGQGSSNPMGAMQGTESVTLTSDQTPLHTHSISATVPVSTANGGQNSAQNGYFAASGQEQYGQGASGQTANVLSGNTTPVGSGQAHENRMPFLALGYFIAMQGIFPQRQ